MSVLSFSIISVDSLPEVSGLRILGSGNWHEVDQFCLCSGPLYVKTSEIDIIEGYQDNFTGPIVVRDTYERRLGNTLTRNELRILTASQSCGVTECSRASYGPTFDNRGGGVFAMKWDKDGIAIIESDANARFAEVKRLGTVCLSGIS